MMQSEAVRSRRSALRAGTAAVVALSTLASSAVAQAPAPSPAVAGPAVGDAAPEFAVVGATRYGVLRDSVRLSQFKGKTVVLAFFYKARTKG